MQFYVLLAICLQMCFMTSMKRSAKKVFVRVIQRQTSVSSYKLQPLKPYMHLYSEAPQCVEILSSLVICCANVALVVFVFVQDLPFKVITCLRA